MRTNTLLRWIHLAFAVILTAYFLARPDGGWPLWVEETMTGIVMGVLTLTGVLKWQLPRIRRRRARRRAAATAARAA